ncbi:MAG TPA: EamA family transporter [Caldilineaceae bacterium]|mgnify:CR=1 FL=1|nr:EamA family transporter [Caldilineaceae bacterium]
MQQNPLSDTTRAGLFMVMLAAVLWGTGNAVARTIYDIVDTNAFSVAFLRMALAVPALLIVCAMTLGRRMWFLTPLDLPYMLGAGALVALYQVSFYAALPRVGVAIATVVALCSAPVIVAAHSAILLRERPSGKTLVALIAAVIGTGLLINVQSSAQQPDVLGGVLLALLAGTLYAINTLVGRKLGSGNRVHPLQTATIGFLFGALILLMIALPMGLVLIYPTTGWLRLAYLGVIPTAAGYTLFFSGMRTTTATAASIATLMEPLTSTLIAVIVLHEPMSPQALVGSGLLVLAMLQLLVR